MGIDTPERHTGEPDRATVTMTFDRRIDAVEILERLEFDSIRYSEYLINLGFNDDMVANTRVNFIACSPSLERQMEHGYAHDIKLGSYNGSKTEKVINLFIFDGILSARKYGESLQHTFNETLLHETGHMYQDLLDGGFPDKRYKHFVHRLGIIGLYGRAAGKSMASEAAVQDILPLYAAYPLTGVAIASALYAGGNSLWIKAQKMEDLRYKYSPRETYANTFARIYGRQAFITANIQDETPL